MMKMEQILTPDLYDMTMREERIERNLKRAGDLQFAKLRQEVTE